MENLTKSTLYQKYTLMVPSTVWFDFLRYVAEQPTIVVEEGGSYFTDEDNVLNVS